MSIYRLILYILLESLVIKSTICTIKYKCIFPVFSGMRLGEGMKVQSHSSFLRGKHLLVHSVIVIVRFLNRKAQSSNVYSIHVSNESKIVDLFGFLYLQCWCCLKKQINQIKNRFYWAGIYLNIELPIYLNMICRNILT